MAGGFAKDGAVLDQIDATVFDLEKKIENIEARKGAIRNFN